MTSMSKETRSGFNQTTRWYINFTTLGGLTQTRDSDNNASRICWIVVFLLGLFMTAFSLKSTLCRYLDHPTTWDLSVTLNQSLEFPAVTVCNANKIHCGNLRNHIIKKNSSSGDVWNLCSLYALGRCDVSNHHSNTLKKGHGIDKKVCEDFIRNATYTANEDDISSNFFKYYSSLNSEDFLTIAHRPDQLFKKCNFTGGSTLNDGTCEKFMSKNSSTIFSFTIGVCYTFNSGVGKLAAENPLKLLAAGPNYGLELEIDIESTYYLRNGLSKYNGVFVVVHNPKKAPAINSDTIQVAPASAAFVKLKTRNVKRQEYPYSSNCVNVFPDSSEGKFFDQIRDTFEYSDSHCLAICQSEFIYNACGYLPFNIIPPYLVEPNITYKITTTQDQCIKDAIKAAIEKNINCKCHSPCDETTYNVEMSVLKWPSNQYWPRVANKYNITYHDEILSEEEYIDFQLNTPSNTSVQDVIERQDEVYQNYLKISIFFKSMAIGVTAENPVFTIMSLFSTVGGDLSLYIGITALSFFELFEYFFRLLKGAITRK